MQTLHAESDNEMLFVAEDTRPHYQPALRCVLEARSSCRRRTMGQVLLQLNLAGLSRGTRRSSC